MIRDPSDVKLYLRRVVKTVLGRDHMIRTDVRLRTMRIGTPYGGWVFTPAPFDGRKPLVLSFGLGDDISFDLGMISRFDAEIRGYDPTPMSLGWLRGQAIPKQMTINAVGLSDHDGVETFSFPHVEGWDDFSIRRKSDKTVECNVAKLSTLIRGLSRRVDIVKMDIEGSEYKVVTALEDDGSLPAQILVEFHHRMHDITVGETLGAVKKLRSLGYLAYDISPWGREFSFIHRSALI